MSRFENWILAMVAVALLLSGIFILWPAENPAYQIQSATGAAEWLSSVVHALSGAFS